MDGVRYERRKGPDGLEELVAAEGAAQREDESTARHGEAAGLYFDSRQELPRDLDFVTPGTLATVDPETGYQRRGELPNRPQNLVVQYDPDGSYYITWNSQTHGGRRVRRYTV